MRLFSVGVLAFIGTFACSKSPTAPETQTVPTQTVHYSGFVHEPSTDVGGVLQMTVDLPASLAQSTGERPFFRIPISNATLTLKNGAVIQMTGHYETSTDTLTLTGGGYHVSFKYNGTKANPDGTFTTLQGIVGVARIILVPAPPPAAVMYCGSFQGTEAGDVFLTIHNGTTVTGTGYERGKPNAPIGITGTAQFPPIDHIELNWSWSGGRGWATGRSNAGDWGGLWENTDGQKGIWSVHRHLCK